MGNIIRVLGIDPGLKHTGCGIIESNGKDIYYLDSGTIDTEPSLPFPKRLLKIYQEINELIDKYKPDVLSIENTIYAQNVSIALKLGHARGIIILAAAKKNIEINEYSPKKIKSSITGNGSAKKEQVQYMVSNMLNLNVNMLSLDSSDALAAAICYINQFKYSGI